MNAQTLTMPCHPDRTMRRMVCRGARTTQPIAKPEASHGKKALQWMADGLTALVDQTARDRYEERRQPL
jgi:hypothetical protein